MEQEKRVDTVNFKFGKMQVTLQFAEDAGLGDRMEANVKEILATELKEQMSEKNVKDSDKG